MPATMKSLLPTKWNWKTEHDNDFVSLQRAMNSLFDDFGKNWELPFFRPYDQASMTWYPHLDMLEEDNDLLVHVELPGLEEKDIDVSVVGDMLTIKGSKKYEKEEKKGTWFHSERSWGNFQRSLPLPFPVIHDQIKAVFKKGVLTITLPKTPEAKKSVHKIPIKTT